MKIVADEKIPLIADYFGGVGELVLKPGRALKAADVSDADIVIVRSVTHVNAALLQDSRVQFVGSVASGADHLDTTWLDSAGIRWASATGCNSTAVVEYVICVLAHLQKNALLTQARLRAAVIGVGRIGSQVARWLEVLGFEVLYCDPFRAQEKNFVATDLADIQDCDFITIHTPLTRKGAHPTYHLIDQAFLQRQKKQTVVLNAARGPVIDFQALAESGAALLWCLDVWEHEPHIDFNIVAQATVATPHIAGHTVQSKQRGLDMIYHAAITQNIIQPQAVTMHFPKRVLDCDAQSMDWRDVVLKIYDPATSTRLMKEKIIATAAEKMFDKLRNDFNSRDELQFVTLKNIQCNPQDKKFLAQLGVKFA